MNLHQVTDKGVVGGDIYRNKEGKLPSVDGRIWYEADINYTGGIRNNSINRMEYTGFTIYYYPELHQSLLLSVILLPCDIHGAFYRLLA